MSQYGCWNKARPTALAPVVVQDGYRNNGKYTIANYVAAPFVMSTGCQYTKTHATDPECSGCVHRAKDAA
jgi:hypothetical protein